ncbi:MAG TPA: pilus assembly protein PilP [Rubrivivax sp.]|nr:pilus assembly protein PilP [Burkholderiales bacterium]HNT40163.1 pilus assembly protein PilP [Rubrivivax sp.]
MNRLTHLPAVLLAAALALAALGGCSGNLDELQQWTELKRREVKPNVPKLEAPKTFEPEPYTAAQAIDPFSAQKLTVALRQEARQLNPLLASELNRRKEPLEAYPLDNMTMVGSFSRGGKPHALLRVDSLLYQVKVGDYLGQNYGRITQIGETELTLREVVQDAVGEWTERISTLQLQEKAR